MSVAHLATSVDGVTLERGAHFRDRRTAIGLSVLALARRANVDRGSLAALEAGKDVRDTTIAQVDRTLTEIEHELGMDAPTQVAEPQQAGGPTIRFVVEGVYGAKALVVEGPVDNLPELEAAVDRIMRRLAGDARTAE